MTEFFLSQLEREVAVSRKVLERVPEGRNDWKPHERSMPMGYLAAACGANARVDRDDAHDRRAESWRQRDEWEFPGQGLRIGRKLF